MKSFLPIVLLVFAAAHSAWLPQERIGAVNDRDIESIEIEPAWLAPLPKPEAKERRVFDKVITQRIDENTIAVYSHDFLLLTVKLKAK